MSSAKHCFPLFPADVSSSPNWPREGWFNVYRDMRGDHYRGSDFHPTRDAAHRAAVYVSNYRPKAVYRIHVKAKGLLT